MSGCWNFTCVSRGGNRDKRLSRLWAHLKALHEDGEFDFVVYEEARCSKHIQALITIAELQSVIKLFCLQHDVPYQGYTAPEIKKWSTSHGRAKKPEMVMAACRLSGKKITSEDEADSVCLYWMAKELLI
jgi:Holliday junction resolvasome RuvABC endonuclease subunit